MAFLYYLFRYSFMIYFISITIVDSYRLIIIPRRNCCKSIGRSAFVPLTASSRPVQQLVQAPGTFDNGVRPEEDPLSAASSKLALSVPPPISPSEDNLTETDKPYLCSRLTCPPQFFDGPVCACNFNNGNVVTFKNKCDLKKHNCRFDTGFKVILNEICPWEFQSRRTGGDSTVIDYDDPKYYN